jgi:hypothetical protein
MLNEAYRVPVHQPQRYLQTLCLLLHQLLSLRILQKTYKRILMTMSQEEEEEEEISKWNNPLISHAAQVQVT